MKNIPFLSFEKMNRQIKQEVMASVERTFDSNWYVLGNGVKEFEQQFAAFTGSARCVGVGNGLEAIHLSLLALGIKKGDEVIVPSNTYIATVLAVSYTGATPVFVEPNEHTFNIDVTKIEKAITSRTKAIIPVHLYGQSCEMEVICALAKKHGLGVVEDNAQSQGASYKNVKTGNWGDINATSFYPGKNLGALGDGGAVTTSNEDYYKTVQTLRNYGSSKKYVNEVIGYNSRLDELQAGVLSVKLQHLDTWSKERRQIAAWYDTYLPKTIDRQRMADSATSVYHLYVILHDKRDELQAFLTSKGIGTLIHYPIPPHLQKAYAHLGFAKGDFPIAEKIADTILSLPLFIGMTEDQVKYVADCIQEFKA